MVFTEVQVPRRLLLVRQFKDGFHHQGAPPPPHHQHHHHDNGENKSVATKIIYVEMTKKFDLLEKKFHQMNQMKW